MPPLIVGAPGVSCDGLPVDAVRLRPVRALGGACYQDSPFIRGKGGIRCWGRGSGIRVSSLPASEQIDEDRRAGEPTVGMPLEDASVDELGDRAWVHAEHCGSDRS